MKPSPSTCWSIIQGAASGREDDREEFVRRYAPAIRSYFIARWQTPRFRQIADDAVQDVLIECFKDGGVIAQHSRGGIVSFRAFLMGTSRNVALRYEGGRAADRREHPAPSETLDGCAGSDERASQAFDRSWARSVVREAALRMGTRARYLGPEALERVEILRLRFFDDLPIREIARAWGVDARDVHRQYDLARTEFASALNEVLAEHHPDRPDDAAADRRMLIRILAESKKAASNGELPEP